MNKVLLNLSNIHAGGALQVAISVVSELIWIEERRFDLSIVVSDEIADAVNMDRLSKMHQVQLLNTYGLKTLFSSLNKLQTRFNYVYTLYGPKYTWLKAKHDVVGFAQLWILEFDNPVTQKMSALSRLKLKLKFELQKCFFLRADHLVVELEHVKASLQDRKLFHPNEISVVHNSLSSLYLDESMWETIEIAKSQAEISIGYVTRDYKHKNIDLLPEVATILNRDYRLPVKFYLSLTDSEWNNYKDRFGNFGATVGSLNVYQCPSFYQQMDAVIFPSLLECFSATPLEALAMRKPLFASDRGFVKDVCKDYALYFDPLCPQSVAQVIADYYQGRLKNNEELQIARQHVLNFSNARQRAKDYLDVINNLIVSENV